MVTCDVRWIRDPSWRVSVVSAVAVAENGAPFTSFPPCIPSKPISSIGAPKGGPSCLCACIATALNNSAPLRTKHVFVFEFIIPSPLLSNPRRVLPRGNLVSVFFLGLRQPHRLRQPVVSNQQIHLYPFARALFIHRQAQPAKRAALHPHAQDRSLFCLVRHGSRHWRKLSRILCAPGANSTSSPCPQELPQPPVPRRPQAPRAAPPSCDAACEIPAAAASRLALVRAPLMYPRQGHVTLRALPARIPATPRSASNGSSAQEPPPAPTIPPRQRGPDPEQLLPLARSSSHFFQKFPAFDYLAAFKRCGTSRNISSFASSRARPRYNRERIVPIGHPVICAASS